MYLFIYGGFIMVNYAQHTLYLFLSEQLCGIKYIHITVQPSKLSIFGNFSSSPA
jgi:hypothetical protein